MPDYLLPSLKATGEAGDSSVKGLVDHCCLVQGGRWCRQNWRCVDRRCSQPVNRSRGNSDYMLFTTCLRLWVKSHCHLLPHRQNMPPNQKAVERRTEEKKSVTNAKKNKSVSFLFVFVFVLFFTFRQPQGDLTERDESHIHSYLKKPTKNSLTCSFQYL